MKKSLLFYLFILCAFCSSAQFPQPAMVGYWENWTAGNFVYFSEIDPRYNVIMVSFASHKDGKDYDLDFIPEPGKYWQDSTLFKQEMTELQNQGKKILLSIGGATYPIMLDSLEEKQVFISSVGEILDQWNFDGLDVDLEGSSLNFENFTIDSFGDPRLTLMVEALQEIMANYRTTHGKKLLLTMAPETHYVQGGMSEHMVINNHAGAYLPMIEALKDSIDMLNVQLYNSGDMPGVNGVYYSQSTPDFILALTEAVIQGFPAAAGLGEFSGLPASKVGVGLPSCEGWGFTEPKVLEATMNYLLGKGPQPGAYSLLQEGGYPELKGMMTWSINTDKNCKNSYAFVELYDQLFNEVPQIKISNPDTIILTQEHGGIILVELKHDVFSTPINPNDWSATNLPQGVQIDSVILMNDTLAKMVLGGSSAPGTEQFHVDNVTITAAAQTFVHSSKPLSKAYGVRLTSLGYFIPTRIEAENFHDMSGSEIRPTSDTDNNTKLGGGTTGAYSTYTILVPETKKYTLDFRYATAMNNKADYSILVNELEILRDTLSGTGGWDSFKTITHEIELPEGKHEFSIYINLGWYGLNWFEIKEGGLNTEQLKMTPIMLHPNPVSDVLHFEKEVEGTITIMNLIGEVTHQFNIAGNKVNVSRFPSGIYHLIIRTQNGNSYFGRFIKR